MKEKKTNAMRVLEQKAIAYEPLYYDLGDQEFSGVAVARLTGIPAERMVKTLTARGTGGEICVFVIPVDAELDMKKAASAAGLKRVELLAVKELLAVTGYVRGEVSPVGMRKRYATFIERAALDWENIYVSAGGKGCSMAIAPRALAEATGAQFADLART